MVDRYEMYYDRFDDCVVADAEDDGYWVSYEDYKALNYAAGKLAGSVLDWFGNGQKSGELMEAHDEYRKAIK